MLLEILVAENLVLEILAKHPLFCIILLFFLVGHPNDPILRKIHVFVFQDSSWIDQKLCYKILYQKDSISVATISSPVATRLPSPVATKLPSPVVLPL